LSLQIAWLPPVQLVSHVVWIPPVPKPLAQHT
jgi:hypothetical protein